ncbi:MAG: xylulokinase, partial [Rhodothermia bacterium]|nr:xylulokinase [Rhodothermia bacterium]
RDIVGIGLTGQMHGLVMLGAEGEVLRPAILWNDQRAAAECDEIRDALGLRRLVSLTGNDAFAGFTAPKLLWVRNHEPEVYARTAQVLLPKDYIRYRLTGAYATDKAGAGGTLMLDLRKRDWSVELLDAIDIPGDWLPPTHEGPEVTGSVIDAAARETGLAEGTPVVGGGGDQAAQAVGVGAVIPEVWGLTLGTSGVVFAPCDQPLSEEVGRVHAFPHAVPRRWHLMGVMLSAAGSLAWYHDTLAPGIDYDDLLQEAAQIAAGSEGLFFQPYLTGERTPHADPYLRASFVGLTARHSRAHITRSVLEGVAFGLRDNLQLLKEVGLPAPREIRLSGGGARSPVWRQILADVLGVELVTVQTTEGAAYGAALLAGVGAGLWTSVEEACEATVRAEDIIVPRADAVTTYSEQHERFRELYPILGPLYRR